jgi:group I intron endonuclease
MQVYLITNLVTGKYYVGKTRKPSLKKYLQDVVSMAKSNKNNRPLLHRSMRKHESPFFVIELLSTCETNDQASLLERLWIISLDSRNNSVGYNISAGGEGSVGAKYSEEAKKRLSESRKGRTPWNKGLSYKNHVPSSQTGSNNPFFGKTHSKESKVKIGDANRNRAWTKEYSDKMRLVKTGFKHSEESIEKMREAARNRSRKDGGQFA